MTSRLIDVCFILLGDKIHGNDGVERLTRSKVHFCDVKNIRIDGFSGKCHQPSAISVLLVFGEEHAARLYSVIDECDEGFFPILTFFVSNKKSTKCKGHTSDW